MTLTSKARAELRAEAHHLSPLVHVGHQGLTDTLVQTIDDTLRTHELVKIALARTTDVKPQDASHQLAERLGLARSSIARWETDTVEPGFSTLRRVLQACGFDLSLALVPFERNPERDARIQEVGRLTPQERLRAMVDRLEGQ